MLLVLVYFSIPIAMVMLLPPLSRMDGSLSDTARMMGFSKIEVFWRVTLPVLRRPIFQTGLLLFLLNSGGFVISQQLGRPSDWMFSVFIADFMRSFNVPFAVALALCLLLTVVVLVGVTYLAFGRRAQIPVMYRILALSGLGVFLYAPILIVFGSSLNSSRQMVFPPSDPSMLWYQAFF